LIIVGVETTRLYIYHFTSSVSLSLSLSGTSENQTFDDKRHNDLINVKETEWTIHRNLQQWVHKTQDENKQNNIDNIGQ
jgi:hypothetical protein